MSVQAAAVATGAGGVQRPQVAAHLRHREASGIKVGWGGHGDHWVSRGHPGQPPTAPPSVVISLAAAQPEPTLPRMQLAALPPTQAHSPPRLRHPACWALPPQALLGAGGAVGGLLVHTGAAAAAGCSWGGGGDGGALAAGGAAPGAHPVGVALPPGLRGRDGRRVVEYTSLAQGPSLASLQVPLTIAPTTPYPLPQRPPTTRQLSQHHLPPGSHPPSSGRRCCRRWAGCRRSPLPQALPLPPQAPPRTSRRMRG